MNRRGMMPVYEYAFVTEYGVVLVSVSELRESGAKFSGTKFKHDNLNAAILYDFIKAFAYDSLKSYDSLQSSEQGGP